LEKNSKIYVAGGQTLIGAAILRELKRQEYSNIVGELGEEPDLTDASQIDPFFEKKHPEYVFLAAGKSGGIEANRKYPAEFMIDNLLIECNVIKSSHKYGVKKLLYLASSCSYPKHCPQPMQVDSLLTGSLEPTNEPYAVAKIAGIKLCQAYCQQYKVNFVSVIPANAFGPWDDFSLENSHVIAALMRKMYEAKIKGIQSVEIWGTGTPRREFIFIDDLANAGVFVLNHYDSAVPINLGSGIDFSIAELAECIKEVVGFQGKLTFDESKPDGMPVKLLDTKELKSLGWKPIWSFKDAIERTYAWFKKQKKINDELEPGL